MHFRTLRASSRTSRLLPRSFANLDSLHMILGHGLRRLASSAFDTNITEDDLRRVYVSGGGARALFHAYCLASLPDPPPITLLTFQRRRVADFEGCNRKVTVEIDGKEYQCGGIDIEYVGPSKNVTPDLAKSSPAPVIPIPKIMASSATSSIPLNYLSRSKPRKEAVLRSATNLKTAETTVATSDEIVDQAAETKMKGKSKLRPILNLVSMEKSVHAVFAINSLRGRLSRQSTVICSQAEMGIVENVYKKAFPSPLSRPTFRVITDSLSVRQGTNDSAYTRNDDGTFDMTHVGKRKFRDDDFRAIWSGKGRVFLGPVSASIKGESIDDVLEERVASAQYLSDLLLEVPQFQAEETDQRTMLFLRLKRVGILSILVPLSAVLGCLRKDVFKTQEGRNIGMNLIRETYEVLRNDMPDGNKAFHLWQLHYWVSGHISVPTNDRMPGLLMDIHLGRSPDLRSNTAWIVSRGNQLGISTPVHEAIIKVILKMFGDRKRVLEELQKKEKEEKRLARIAKSHEPREPKARDLSNDNPNDMDRVERRRFKKAMSIKARLGKQEHSKDYTAPKIQPMGNLHITRNAVGKKSGKKTSKIYAVASTARENFRGSPTDRM